MTSILELKKNRANSLSKLTDAADKVNNGGNVREKDARYWQPEVDKMGNGYAVIRFLDAPAGEDIPFVKLFNHAFDGPGGWYIENSLTTLGQPDPVSEFNSALWKEGEATGDKGPERTQVRKQKRKLNFISNILVVKHPSRPEDEGKVFLYKYGKKIFDKLNKKMNPDIPDVEAFNPFDFWTGANFRLVVNKDGKYRSYNDSEFADRSPIVPEGDNQDDQIDRLWKSCLPLQAEIGPEQFKTYDELQKQLTKVLSAKAALRQRPTEDSSEGSNTIDEPTEQTTRRAAPSTVSPAKAEAFAAAADDSDDDDMSYFQNLLKGGGK